MLRFFTNILYKFSVISLLKIDFFSWQESPQGAVLRSRLSFLSTLLSCYTWELHHMELHHVWLLSDRQIPHTTERLHLTKSFR